MIRNRSPAKQQRLSAGSQFQPVIWSIPPVLGLKDVTRCAISARETCVLSALGLEQIPERRTLMRPDRPRPASRE
jgi:hypothetical protein